MTAIPVIDCHSDVAVDVYRRRAAGERAVLRSVHLPSYRAGGVVASVCAIGGDAAPQCPFGLDRPFEGALALLDALEADVAESDGAFEIVTSASAVAGCVERGTFAIVPAIEGAMPLEGDLGKLELLHERGVRVVGLTWNTRNELAVGLDSGPGGLTELGVEAVRLMNELGIVVDLSHASPTTFWHVAELSRAPLYASHSNARAVHDHPRNLDDEQLRAIAGSGGIVGVVFCPTFVGSPPVTLDTVLDHFAYLHHTIGEEAIVIGADFIDYAIEEMNRLAAQSQLYDAGTAYYPPGIETVASMQNVITALPSRGFDEAAVRNVALGNFLRLFARTEEVATAPRAA